MITRVYKMSENSPDTAALSECAKALSAGGLVVFPTETVYGLAANGLDGRACDNVFRVKSRPDEKGLILLLPRDFDVSEIAVVNDAYLTFKSQQFGNSGVPHALYPDSHGADGALRISRNCPECKPERARTRKGR